MKILVLNRGSTSIKTSLFENFSGKYKLPTFEKDEFIEHRINGVDVIGHRVVYGGSDYPNGVIIDAEVKEKITSISSLAPLHNKQELEDIKKMEKLYPNTPQVALFDSAFHHTLPKKACIYPGPYKWFQDGIKRFGFHGISFQYCTKQATKILTKDPKNLKLVICHLGGGSSLAAIENGKSIDTTMGFTPLEGMMMDTRCGSIDPGILLYLLKNKTPNELSNELYHNSGLLGISGIQGGMKEILKSDSQRAKLALDIYIHRLISLIGQMIASLQGIDALIFTGGIGENVPIVREKAMTAFSFLGLKIEDNQNSKQDKILSSPRSKVKALLIHTQEAYQIASACFSIFSK